MKQSVMSSRVPGHSNRAEVALSVHLFGTTSASLCCPQRVQSLALSPRSAELLAFLALGRGRYFGRSEIAEAIWDADDEVSTGSVNTALWRLRRSIELAPAKAGDFLIVNRQGCVGLNGPVQMQCDVQLFEQLVQTHRAITTAQLSEARQQHLEIAVALYRESALAEFRSAWALRERERLRNAYLDALQRLMQHSAAKHDYGGAIHYARRLLATDGLREDVHRVLMRYLVLDGQRAAALRQFDACRTALKRELAIQPMRETFAVYQQIADKAVCGIDGPGEA